MIKYTRKEILTNLNQKIKNKEPIIVGGAGYGLMAKAEEAGGIDLIMAYNTGPYRMDGHVSLIGYRPYGDSNADTMRLGHVLSGVIKKTPVIAGIGPTDPYRTVDRMMEEIDRIGFSGITNVPSAAGAEKETVFRNVIKAYGMGVQADIELIKKCVQRDVFSIFYTFSEEALRASVAAGVDVVSVHAGGTSGGTTGNKSSVTLSTAEACELTGKYYEIAKKENPDIIVLTHGGPFEKPENVRICFETTPIHGFIGASSVERIPVEKEVLGTVQKFMALKLR